MKGDVYMDRIKPEVAVRDLTMLLMYLTRFHGKIVLWKLVIRLGKAMNSKS